MTDDGTYLYYYDCENRLTDVNDVNDTPVASYTYDFAGRRVKKVVYGEPNVIRRYLYDGDRVIAEYDEYGLIKASFIYGPGIDEPIAIFSTALYYCHYDGLGSVIALSNWQGIIAERYEYDVFGKCIVHTSAGVDGVWMTDDDTTATKSALRNPYMFTGRRLDDETGLYYYRARYYSPETGRFIQPDPIRYSDGLNMYAYCGNNPINWIDPYGLDWYPPQWASGIIGGIGDAAGWLHDTLDTPYTQGARNIAMGVGQVAGGGTLMSTHGNPVGAILFYNGVTQISVGGSQIIARGELDEIPGTIPGMVAYAFFGENGVGAVEGSISVGVGVATSSLSGLLM